MDHVLTLNTNIFSQLEKLSSRHTTYTAVQSFRCTSANGTSVTAREPRALTIMPLLVDCPAVEDEDNGKRI